MDLIVHTVIGGEPGGFKRGGGGKNAYGLGIVLMPLSTECLFFSEYKA